MVNFFCLGSASRAEGHRWRFRRIFERGRAALLFENQRYPGKGVVWETKRFVLVEVGSNESGIE